MSNAIADLTNTVPITAPKFTKGINHYEFKWESFGITAKLENIDNDSKGELSVIHRNGGGDKLLLYKDINLLSILSCSQITKQLQKNSPQIAWDDVLTYITHLTLDDIRRGKPLAEIGNEPVSMKTNYLLKPILVKDSPTTLFASGGSGKSYLSDYIAIILQNGITGMDGLWIPQGECNVLYLDWESDDDTHRRRVWAIKKGLKQQPYMNTDLLKNFKYQEMERPLTESIQLVQNLVVNNSIDLIIVDSQMAAQDNGADQSAVAQRYYNALRSFHCTSLTIDHVAKDDWKGTTETVAPYGSVSKFNRSRAQFQLTKSQNAGDDYIECCLRHLKNNDGRLQKPLGIRIDFENNSEDEDILDYVKFSVCDLEDNPTLSKNLEQWQRVVNVLKENKGNPMTPKDIAESSGLAADAVYRTLDHYKEKFKKVNEKAHLWGLLDNVH